MSAGVVGTMLGLGEREVVWDLLGFRPRSTADDGELENGDEVVEERFGIGIDVLMEMRDGDGARECRDMLRLDALVDGVTTGALDCERLALEEDRREAASSADLDLGSSCCQLEISGIESSAGRE